MDLQTITIVIEDEKGKKSSIRFHTPYRQSSYASWYPDSYHYVQQVVRSLDALITGRVIRATKTFNIPLPSGIKVLADTFSDVEETALFTYRTLDGQQTWNHGLPTMNEAFVSAGSDVIDINQPEVLEFMNLLARPDLDFAGAYEDLGAYTIRGEEIHITESAVARFKAR